MVGEIILFAGSRTPENWLDCKGQRISEREYPELFSVVGPKVPDLTEPVTGVKGTLRTRVEGSNSNPEVVLTVGRVKGVRFIIRCREDGLNETQKAEVQRMIDESSSTGN